VDSEHTDLFAPGTPLILPIPAVAAILGLTTRAVRKAALANELPTVMIDGQPYILREPLRRLLSGETPLNLPAATPAPPGEAPMTDR
jgi:hypothetical protein